MNSNDSEMKAIQVLQKELRDLILEEGLVDQDKLFAISKQIDEIIEGQ